MTLFSSSSLFTRPVQLSSTSFSSNTLQKHEGISVLSYEVFSTLQRYVPFVAYHRFLPHIYVQLLVKTFILLHAVFYMAIMDLNLRVYHLASFIIWVPK
jgi:hypothetical protein